MPVARHIRMNGITILTQTTRAASAKQGGKSKLTAPGPSKSIGRIRQPKMEELNTPTNLGWTIPAGRSQRRKRLVKLLFSITIPDRCKELRAGWPLYKKRSTAR